MRPKSIARLGWGSWVALLLLASGPDSREVLRIGQDGQIAWDGRVSSDGQVATIPPEHRSLLNPNITEIGTSPGGLIELKSSDYPEGLLPKRVREDQNLATDIALRGGVISAPKVFDLSGFELAVILAELLTDEPTGGAFERKEESILGSLLVLDLGTRFGVNQIRFFPRNTVFPSPATPFQNDFLKNFEVQINDGLVLTEAGNPIWETYEIRENNDEPITVVDIDPPRYIRFLRIRATSGIPFEVEKLQVFGEGFLPAAQYISPIIDMGTPANWGLLRTGQELEGKRERVQIQIRTRSGNDPAPLVYTRKRVGRQDAREIPFSVANPSEPLSRKEYLDLVEVGRGEEVWERGPVKEDLENWSPWTSPYSIEEATGEEGTPIRSPGPRRYFQFRVDFLGDDLESSHVLNHISFDFSSPPLADALIGEIFPREVPAATDIPFVYAVRAEMESGEIQSFDSFEVLTPSRVEGIERIEVIANDGSSLLDHTFAVQNAVTEEGEVAITSLTDRGFAVRFPPVQEHDTVLKVHFVSRVLSYSTIFSGRALLLQEDAFQDVISGDATALDAGDISSQSGLIVLSPSVRTGNLIGNFELGSGIFTPNGDAVNDALEMEYEVLAVVGQARILVDIFDLAGRRVRRLFDREGENGVYDSVRFAELRWDGTDEQGQRVTPGIYLVRLEVEGDARSGTSVRAIGVVY